MDLELFFGIIALLLFFGILAISGLGAWKLGRKIPSYVDSISSKTKNQTRNDISSLPVLRDRFSQDRDWKDKTFEELIRENFPIFGKKGETNAL